MRTVEAFKDVGFPKLLDGFLNSLRTKQPDFRSESSVCICVEIMLASTVLPLCFRISKAVVQE